MKKPIEEYTNEELQKSIDLHETEIEKDRKTEHPNRDLRNGIEKKEEFQLNVEVHNILESL